MERLERALEWLDHPPMEGPWLRRTGRFLVTLATAGVLWLLSVALVVASVGGLVLLCVAAHHGTFGGFIQDWWWVVFSPLLPVLLFPFYLLWHFIRGTSPTGGWR